MPSNWVKAVWLLTPPSAGDPKLRLSMANCDSAPLWPEVGCRNANIAHQRIPWKHYLPLRRRSSIRQLAMALVQVVCPNPFYQIYEGAALLAGAQPYSVPSVPSRNFAQDWDSVPESVWASDAAHVCVLPGNPAGAVMPLSEWGKLFALSDRYGFVIASDECYSGNLLPR